MKRIFRLSAFALAVIMVITCSVTAFAKTYLVTEDGYKFEVLTSDTLELVDYTGDSTDLVVPSGTAGKTVVSVATMAFSDNEQITSFDFSNAQYLTKIGNYAFNGMKNLKSVILSDSITKLGIGLFMDCVNMESANITENISTIPTQAFYGCSNLSEVTLSDSVTTINGYAFANCASLKQITLGKNVTAIAPTSFDNDDELTIYCYRDSYAHRYAVENNIDYYLIDGYVLGDVNMDGYISITDATIMQKNIVGLSELSDLQKVLADVNADGYIDITDATMIQKICVDLIPEPTVRV